MNTRYISQQCIDDKYLPQNNNKNKISLRNFHSRKKFAYDSPMLRVL